MRRSELKALSKARVSVPETGDRGQFRNSSSQNSCVITTNSAIINNTVNNTWDHYRRESYFNLFLF